ncbi:tetratricopeptide repeat protein [Streptomyces sp. NPDC090106]|uniref:tetratricopeptide repeat protein n=1 Tax=Streptomyces sp. NPDC090106 TaxID=3365946 RepID=UPI003804CE1C
MTWLPWPRRKNKPHPHQNSPTPHQPAARHTVSAGTGGVAAGESIKASALGDNSTVNYAENLYLTQAGTPVQWPVVVGTVPVLASAFQPRTGLRQAVDEARGHSSTVVLASDSTDIPATDSGARTLVQVMTGGGGVGKSQLAAAYAREAVQDGIELVLWTPATEVQQVITTYAQAAHLVQAPGRTGEDLQTDAHAFLHWLTATDRQWLIVLDDVTDLNAIEPWWPDSQRNSGWVLATTRLKDPRLTGGGRTRIDVDVYTPAEATSYLTNRLTHDRKTNLLDDQTPALAKALGYLPLALGHAAAYMLRENTPCTAYLTQFTDRAARLNELLPRWADTERYGRQITTTLLLALEAITQDRHGALAHTTLRAIAFLDPAGHPDSLWNTVSLITYLANRQHSGPSRRTLLRRRTPRSAPVSGTEAQAALRLLDRYGLITYDTAIDPHRAVRIHALTARAVRETIAEDQLPPLAVAAADALLEVWPKIDQPHPDLAASLRANTDALAANALDLLWQPDGHPVLFRAGRSLFDAGLAASAAVYWQSLSTISERVLGGEHPDTLTVRGNLAASYWQAGRTGEAIEILERVLADRERLVGGEHPDTLTARANLAASYWQAGRTGEAIELLEQVVADRERLGEENPDTLLARANLAASYRQAGRTGEAIEILERVLADRERLVGEEHPDTLTARANLASSYRQAGRTGEAIVIEERVLADRERLLGGEHPDTLTACGNLAASYRQAGRTGEAIELLEQVVADRERLGEEHPSTLTARGNLASSYRQAGRTGEAIVIEEQVLADSERLLGEEHPDTLTARANLAASYWQAGRTGEAIVIEEQVLADSERLLGGEHPDTLTARASLAASYWQAGRTGEAIELLEQVVADRERLLGEEHPHTLTARGNLASSYWQAGRTGEAIAIEEQVVADRERLLGGEHPHTLTARANLAASYRQAGRTGEAIAIEEQVLADSERLLGEEHPDTLTARANLAASYWQAGRTGEAIELLEQVVADQERVSGGEHPDTLAARAALSEWQALGD